MTICKYILKYSGYMMNILGFVVSKNRSQYLENYVYFVKLGDEEINKINQLPL